MGFKIKIKKPKIKVSLPKAVTNITKPVSSAISSAIKPVGNLVASPVNLVTDLAKGGNIGNSFSNFGESVVGNTAGAMTFGQTKLVDKYSGGYITSLKGAARGNSEDIFKLGSTALKAYTDPTGLATELAVNALVKPPPAFKDDSSQAVYQNSSNKSNKNIYIFGGIAAAFLLVIVLIKNKR